jgi:hypothetical protein
MPPTAYNCPRCTAPVHLGQKFCTRCALPLDPASIAAFEAAQRPTVRVAAAPAPSSGRRRWLVLPAAGGLIAACALCSAIALLAPASRPPATPTALIRAQGFPSATVAAPATDSSQAQFASRVSATQTAFIARVKAGPVPPTLTAVLAPPTQRATPVPSAPAPPAATDTPIAPATLQTPVPRAAPETLVPPAAPAPTTRASSGPPSATPERDASAATPRATAPARAALPATRPAPQAGTGVAVDCRGAPLVRHGTCPQYPNWREAQCYYLSVGGVSGPAARMDADHDGIACENLPGAPPR